MTWYSETKQAYIDRQWKEDSVCVNYDPRNPERSAIEPGTVPMGKYLAAGIALLLLGVLALVEKGVRPWTL